MPELALRIRDGGGGGGGWRELELAFDHPMESGARRDGQGTLIPPWYLTRVTLRHDGRPLATLGPGPAVARNPHLTLALPPDIAGGTLEVAWEDNRGERGSRTLAVPDEAATPSVR